MNLKEEIIAIIKSADYEPMSVSDFQDALGLSSADSFRDLIKILVELEQTGMVTRTKQDRYQKQQQKTNSGLVRGTLSQNKRDLPFTSRRSRNGRHLYSADKNQPCNGWRRRISRSEEVAR